MKGHIYYIEEFMARGGDGFYSLGRKQRKGAERALDFYFSEVERYQEHSRIQKRVKYKIRLIHKTTGSCIGSLVTENGKIK